MAIDLSDYNDVPSRIAEFREKHPDGSLQSEVVETGHPGFVAVKGYAYRTPDDPRPGVGLAWEPVPGATAFTKDSELQNAETSAWGRAIIAVGAADAKKGIASQEEIRNRQAPASTERQTNQIKADLLEMLGGDSDEARLIYFDAADSLGVDHQMPIPADKLESMQTEVEARAGEYLDRLMMESEEAAK